MATSTPWGTAQSVTNIARGIRSVSTAGHGGVLLSPTKNALVPDYMRDESGAYEEDCDWCIPAIVFEAEWRAWADSTTWTNGDEQINGAWSSLKSWHPNAFEAYTGTTLLIGESYLKDKRTLDRQVHDKFVVRSAWGDWQPGVPSGMVGVLAHRNTDGADKYFLVPKAEYDNRSNTTLGLAGCFVVSQDRHQEVAAFA